MSTYEPVGPREASNAGPSEAPPSSSSPANNYDEKAPSSALRRPFQRLAYNMMRIGTAPESSSRRLSVHTVVSILCAACMALFGYDQGVFGGIIVGNRFIESFNNPSPSIVGFVTSIFDIGCFIGSLLTMAFGDVLGRKRCFILGGFIMGIGSVLQTFAWNIPALAWGRVIAVRFRMSDHLLMPSHSEMVKAHQRGKAVVIELLINIVGFVISNWTTLAFSRWRTSSLQWRIPLGIQFVFVGVIFAVMPYVPESPRWLVMRGREEKAKRIMDRLFPGDNKMFTHLTQAVQRELANDSVSWADLFKWKTELAASRRLYLGVCLQAMQQLSGINIVSYYLPLVLQKSVGMSEDLSRIVAACNSVLYMFASALPLIFIERFGRRPLLISSAVLQGLCFLVASASLGVGDEHPGEKQTTGIAATVAFCAYFFFFGGLGWLSIPWLYPAEINTATLRTKGSALATASDWIFITPIGIEHLKFRFYIIFMFLNFLFVFVVYFFYPETAGRSLEEINDLFRRNDTVIVQKMTSVKRAKSELPTTRNRRSRIPGISGGARGGDGDDLDVMLDEFNVDHSDLEEGASVQSLGRVSSEAEERDSLDALSLSDNEKDGALMTAHSDHHPSGSSSGNDDREK